MRVNNLHVHSKIFSTLIRPGMLAFYLRASRLGVKIPVVIRAGHWRGKALARLASPGMSPLGRLVAAAPGGQKVLRFLAGSAPVPLSNRRRQVFEGFLPRSPLKKSSPWALVDISVTGGAKKNAATTVTVSLWHEGHEAVKTLQSGKKFPPDATWKGTDLAQILASLTELASPTIVVTTELAIACLPETVSSDRRQLLWPDTEKPGDEIVGGPARGNALSFSSAPQPLTTALLRDMFSTPEETNSWARQVTADNFVPSLLCSYGNWVMAHHRNAVQLARRPA